MARRATRHLPVGAEPLRLGPEQPRCALDHLHAAGHGRDGDLRRQRAGGLRADRRCLLADGSCYISGEGSCGHVPGRGHGLPALGPYRANGDCTIRTSANCSFIGGTWQGAPRRASAPRVYRAKRRLHPTQHLPVRLPRRTFLGGACPAAGCMRRTVTHAGQLLPVRFQGGNFLAGPARRRRAVSAGRASCSTPSSAFQNARSRVKAPTAPPARPSGPTPPPVVADTSTVEDSIVVTSTTPLSSFSWS